MQPKNVEKSEQDSTQKKTLTKQISVGQYCFKLNNKKQQKNSSELQKNIVFQTNSKIK